MIQTGNFGIVDKTGNIVFSPRNFEENKEHFIKFLGKHKVGREDVTANYHDFGDYKLVPEVYDKPETIEEPYSIYSGEEIFFDGEKRAIVKRKRKLELTVSSLKERLKKTVEADKRAMRNDILFSAGPLTFRLDDEFLSDLAFIEAILARNLEDTAMVTDADGVPHELSKTQFIGLYRSAFKLRHQLLIALRKYLDNQAVADTMEACTENRKTLKRDSEEVLKNFNAKLKGKK